MIVFQCSRKEANPSIIDGLSNLFVDCGDGDKKLAIPVAYYCYLFNKFTNWSTILCLFLRFGGCGKESLHWILLIYWTSFNFIVLHNCYVIIIILYRCCRFLRLPWVSDNCQCHTPFPWGTLRLIYRLFHHGLLFLECGSMRFGCLTVFHLIGLPCFFLLPLCNPQKFFRSCRAGSLGHRLLGFSIKFNKIHL